MARPADWAPLAEADPVPGDPEGIRDEVEHMKKMAEKLRTQAAAMKAIGDSNGLKGQYADKLGEKAGGLSKRLDLAEDRYREVKCHLKGWADDMGTAQKKADRALEDAKDAQRILDSHKPDQGKKGSQMFLPPRVLTDGVYRGALFVYGTLPTGIGLGIVIVSPWGRSTAIGAGAAAVGLGVLRRWWQLRPELTGRAGQLQLRGAVLALVGAALVALSLGLFFNTTEPGDPLSVFIPTVILGGLGIGCWVARVAVGIQTRHATRASVPVSRGQGAARSTGRRLRDRMR